MTHIDDNAIKAITKHYEATFPKAQAERDQIAVLDMCSSWISHYPAGFSAGRVVGAPRHVVFCSVSAEHLRQLYLR